MGGTGTNRYATYRHASTREIFYLPTPHTNLSKTEAAHLKRFRQAQSFFSETGHGEAASWQNQQNGMCGSVFAVRMKKLMHP